MNMQNILLGLAVLAVLSEVLPNVPKCYQNRNPQS